MRDKSHYFTEEQQTFNKCVFYIIYLLGAHLILGTNSN